MIKGVIFDCDGLIIDTETTWYYANKELYSTYQVDLPIALYATCIGNPNFNDFHPYEYLREQAKMDIDIDDIRLQAKNIHKRMMEEVELRPGVRQYFKDAKRLGLKIGLASSSPRAWIEEHLTKFGLLDQFDWMQTGEMVERVKPYPDLYEKAIEGLGLERHEVITFEDSVNGLKAAKAAGLTCVIVPNEATSYLTFKNYDYKLSSMEEMPLEDLIKVIEKII